MSNNHCQDRFLYLTVFSRGKMRCVRKRHRPATAGPSHAVNTTRYLFLHVKNKLPVALILVVCAMASKRRQGDGDKTVKKKKKQKSCEEKAQLCPLVEDEQLKRAVREAWSQKSHYSQGRFTEHNSFTNPHFVYLADVVKEMHFRRP